jgi:hypothetical protein
VIESNPALGVRKIIDGNQSERRLLSHEVTTLGHVMRQAIDESPVAIAAVQLMLLTGFRRMETLALRHD